MFTNFEWGALAKKRNFLANLFQKELRNAFFGLFFQNFACVAEKLDNIGTKQCFGRAQKITFVDLKNY